MVLRRLWSVGALFLGALVCGLALHAVPPRGAPIAAAQAVPATTAGPLAAITVTGEGSAVAPPDLATLSLGVQSDADSAKAAADANSTTMAAVLAAIKSNGVPDKDVQTSAYAIAPIYASQQGNQGKSTITGYRVTNSVSVTIEDLSAVSKVLDAAVQAGANNSVGISFGLKDTTALQEKALAAAVQQASAKAGAIATAAGMKLTGAYSVTEASAGRPVGIAQPLAAAAASAPTPIEQGQLTVRATVEVAYTYTR